MRIQGSDGLMGSAPVGLRVQKSGWMNTALGLLGLMALFILIFGVTVWVLIVELVLVALLILAVGAFVQRLRSNRSRRGGMEEKR